MDDVLRPMRKIILTLSSLIISISSRATVGPLINGNQINPATNIQISTLTVTGNAFSVGRSTLVVSGASVIIGTTSIGSVPDGTPLLDLYAPITPLNGVSNRLYLRFRQDQFYSGWSTQDSTDSIGGLQSNGLGAAVGGMRWYGITASTSAWRVVALSSFTETGNAAQMDSAVNYDISQFATGSPGQAGTPGANANLFGIRSGGGNVNRFIVKGNGDTVQTGSMTATGLLLNTGAQTTFRVVNNGSYNILSLNGNDGSTIANLIGLQAGQSNDPNLYVVAKATVSFYTGGTEKMRINNTAITTGGALCLNSSKEVSKCTSAVDGSGNCTCP